MSNARNRCAANRQRSIAKPVPAFPIDVVIPPRRGASARAVEVPVLSAPDRQVKKPKQKSTPRRPKTSAKPRAVAAVIALPQRAEPLAEPGIDLAAWSALVPHLPAVEPLPRARALAVQSGGGLLVAVADWLGARTLQLWRRLGGLDRSAPNRRTPRPEDELQRLRAENERLRLQLEALLALKTGAGGSQAASPA